MPIQPRAYDPRFRVRRRRRGEPEAEPESAWRASERLAHALALEQERNERRPTPPPAWIPPRDWVEYRDDECGRAAMERHQRWLAGAAMRQWEHSGADPATDPRLDRDVERLLGPPPQGPLAPEPPEPLRPQRQPYVDRLGRRPGVLNDWRRSAPKRPEHMRRPPPPANNAEALERLQAVVAAAPYNAPHSRVKRVLSVLLRLQHEGLGGDLRGRAAWLRRAAELGIEDYASKQHRESAGRILLGAYGLPMAVAELRRLRDAGLPLVEPVPVPAQQATEPSDKAVAIRNGVPADWHLGGPTRKHAL